MLKRYALISLTTTLCYACSTGAEQYTAQPSSSVQPNFATEDLHELLIAEVAYQRGHYDLALRHYHNTTLSSRNKKLAAHTTRLALEMNQPNMALEPAILWANQALSNPKPQALVALMLISSKNYIKALPYLGRITINQKAKPYLKLVTEESTPVERAHLSALFSTLHQQQTFHPEAALIIAKFIHTERPQLARAILTDILIKRPNWTEAISFKNQIHAN
ncbi:hypothetical protein Psal071_00759 [Piscirickettsia salmonis]|uniref:Uncharacterized protein n=1 Tax=Piscirickettsia salmonis TaxID=1238 RepID=A0A9Q6LI39_PISSA|nr:hypothetical protein [Piscirickettsia salmonis]QGN95917.1 hypothetical protein Psal006a_02545 [Piscirickettsia salmonis]QGO05132.1 hypothetical protein Psal009_01013 [Piscirickettsia salmonis]QGO33453.1 hypothetical protein Psal028_00760 [Piscirickettsia salmonis]QGO37065.1 hypothetical protein Psal040_00760 [Piscirickettsia salmonis]QGO40689.1 hypothetical protein Psal041_00759 [Piscirickettsia salmonis]